MVEDDQHYLAWVSLWRAPVEGEEGRWFRIDRWPADETGGPSRGGFGVSRPLLDTPGGGIEVSARVDAGEITGLLLTSPGRIAQRDLRRLALGRMLAQYAEHVRGSDDAPTPRLRARSGPKPPTEEELQRFADVYRRNLATQRHRATTATAEELGLSKPSARRWRARCERAGLLEREE